MSKLRIPYDKISTFKTFFVRFAYHLEQHTGTEFQGSELLDLMAISAGHKSYSQLLFDAKTFGSGPFNLQELIPVLSLQVAKLTNNTVPVCQFALTEALRDIGESPTVNIVAIGNRRDHLHIASDHPPKSFGHPANSTETQKPSESANQSGAVDLDKINDGRMVGDIEKTIIFRMMVKRYLANSIDIRKGIEFHGEYDSIFNFLCSFPEHAPVLLQNDSINRKIFQHQTGQSHLRFGELIAGRARPTAMDAMDQEVLGILTYVKPELPQVFQGVYDLHVVSAAIYNQIPNRAQFTQLDLAGWFFDNAGILGISICIPAKS